ncbi:TPA: bifunctional 4-hydroxy-2-oxoglutarate aldolase/2-dehydro-3-deoxy-phosphogluconate aldolase [Klebsiella pneumoniae]|nr:bifunctional 4-hydroxy-2-oxoglutarate aldolase/2-dehydro-3-deoxy-phosphogluconate aldolase [Klebsiella pneumoniae]HDT1950914.1 bifunctional 4-hydroxy-2-oxoglutarate aldolase/2-dehydro-3-deoxy-phosphogluconate aldolase [Klebsiella pneumoniae]
MPTNRLTALDVMQLGPVIPVLVIDDVDTALPVARALIDGGVKVLEVTLRTPSALEVIRRIADNIPDAIVGAGTVTNPRQFRDAEAAGARFIISPGISLKLLDVASASSVPYLPGISTISELMYGKDAGLSAFKFFPAEANGGITALKAIGGPFSDIRFCPTGGITLNNAGHYLSQPNVVCVGGSWLVTREDLVKRNYAAITTRAKEASLLKTI